MAFVAGKNRVPSPAAGNTAFLTFMLLIVIYDAIGARLSQ
jgi:hypothetical protein